MMTSTSNAGGSCPVPVATHNAQQRNSNQILGNHHGGMFNFQILDGDESNQKNDAKPLIDIIRERRNAFEKEMLEKKTKRRKARKTAKSAKNKNVNPGDSVPANNSNWGFSLNPCGIFSGSVEVALKFHPYTLPKEDDKFSHSKSSNGENANNVNEEVFDDKAVTIPPDPRHIISTAKEVSRKEKKKQRKKAQKENQISDMMKSSKKSDVVVSGLQNSCKENETMSSKSGRNKSLNEDKTEDSEGKILETPSFRVLPSILKATNGTANSTQRNNTLEPGKDEKSSSPGLSPILHQTALPLNAITKTTTQSVSGNTKLAIMNSMASAESKRKSIKQADRKCDFSSIPTLKRQKMIIHKAKTTKTSLSTQSDGSSESGKDSRGSFSKWTGFTKLSFATGLSKHASKHLNTVESNKTLESKGNPFYKRNFANSKERNNPFAGKTHTSFFLDGKKTHTREAGAKKRVARSDSDTASKGSRKCRKTRVEQRRTVGKDMISEHFSGGTCSGDQRRESEQLHTRKEKRKCHEDTKQQPNFAPNNDEVSKDRVKTTVECDERNKKRQSGQAGESNTNVSKPCTVEENAKITADYTFVEKNSVTDDLLLLPKESEGIEVCSLSTTNLTGHSHGFHGNPDIKVEATSAEMSDLTSDAFGQKIPIEEQFYISVKRRVPKKATWQDPFGTFAAEPGTNSLLSCFDSLTLTSALASKGNPKKVNPFQQYHQSARDLREQRIIHTIGKRLDRPADQSTIATVSSCSWSTDLNRKMNSQT